MCGPSLHRLVLFPTIAPQCTGMCCIFRLFFPKGDVPRWGCGAGVKLVRPPPRPRPPDPRLQQYSMLSFYNALLPGQSCRFCVFQYTFLFLQNLRLPRKKW